MPENIAPSIRNPFAGYDVEVKMEIPEDRDIYELVDLFGALVNKDYPSQTINYNQLSYYYCDDRGKNVGKIIEDEKGGFTPKRKTSTGQYKELKEEHPIGLAIKREKIGYRADNLKEAEATIKRWVKEECKTVITGPNLLITKIKVPLYVPQEKKIRLINLTLDESKKSVDSSHPSLQQLGLEYKGEVVRALDQEEESMDQIVATLLKIAKRVRKIVPGLEFTSLSKYRWARGEI